MICICCAWVGEGIEKRRKRDTIDDVLEAPDRGELLAWLRQRPLMHVEGGFALVHAGLLPQWSSAGRPASTPHSLLRPNHRQSECHPDDDIATCPTGGATAWPASSGCA
jgi:bis(5'-nucleosyl)-tetraphosphatase (symmetrical)